MTKLVGRRHFLQSAAVGAGAATWTARSYAAIAGANERLRLGVIGCGSMADSHTDALLAMRDTDRVEVGAVCDVYQKRMDLEEILRVIDSLQLTAKYSVATPVNWRDGDNVIIVPAVTDEQAKEKFPGGWKAPKPYLASSHSLTK